MKKKAITLVIFLISISLVGMVFTQLYWVNKSLKLREEQFDNGVRLAIKSVLNQLLENKKDSVFQKHLNEISCRKDKLEITDIIVPDMIDSLLKKELGSMVPNRNYYFGIYNKLNKRFVAGDFQGSEAYLLISPFQFSLSGIFKPGDYYLSIYLVGKTGIIINQMKIWLLISVFFLVILIFSFAYVIFAILQQKKLSEMKTDFINNMTHEFKTPIATTALAAEMILKPDIADNKNKIRKYAQIILDENTRLQGQVEQVLQLSLLEKGSYRFKFKKTNIHQLLQILLRSFDLRIKDEKIKFTVKLKAENCQVNADRGHMMNVFYNLLDNAIKYSPENPEIQLKSWNDEKGIYISVQDSGIGISPAHQKLVFKNLYRVPTGNIHEVRGFGLGLFYVKTVIDQHDGRINLISELGKGSTFEVYLPLIFD